VRQEQCRLGALWGDADVHVYVGDKLLVHTVVPKLSVLRGDDGQFSAEPPTVTSSAVATQKCIPEASDDAPLNYSVT